MFGKQDATPGGLATDARQSANEGRQVFAARVNIKFKVSKGPDQDLPHLAEIIEGVEAEGWTLDRFEVAATSAAGFEVAYLVFRR